MNQARALFDSLRTPAALQSLIEIPESLHLEVKECKAPLSGELKRLPLPGTIGLRQLRWWRSNIGDEREEGERGGTRCNNKREALRGLRGCSQRDSILSGPGRHANCRRCGGQFV